MTELGHGRGLGRTRTPADRRVLIAGVGNVFLSDDGFGVEVVRRLREHELPAHVEVADIGVRGVDLAYRLLDGYGSCVLLDACARGGRPGTLYRIDTASQIADAATRAIAFDGHRMTPDTVLALLGTLSAGTGAQPPHTIEVVGCEPADLEEGMGLSAPVAAAVPQAVQLILRMIASGVGQSPDRSHSWNPDQSHSHPAGAAPAHADRDGSVLT